MAIDILNTSVLYKAANCDTDHYLVVAKVMDRLTVGKQRSQTSYEEVNISKELNKAE
jgi:hypothetical protein